MEEIYEYLMICYSVEFIGLVNVFEGLLKVCEEDGLVIDVFGLVYLLKVDVDVFVVDNVLVYVVLCLEKVMLCELLFVDGYNFVVGEVVYIVYFGDLFIYYVWLKSG